MTLDHSNMNLQRQHNHHTRNKKVLKQPLAKNPHYQKSPFVKGLSDYAALPLELRKTTNWKLFNSNVKEFVLKVNQ